MNCWEIFSDPSTPVLDQILGDGREFRFRTRHLAEGKSRLVQMLTLEYEDLRVDIAPTRGMGIWKAWRAGREFGWQSPVQGPVHPSLVPLSAPDGLGWLEGFDEMMVRCGLESNGAPEHGSNGVLKYGVHGKIANCPAQDVTVEFDDDTGRLAVSAVVEETRFLFYRLRLETRIELKRGSHQIFVSDRVVNEGGTATGFQLLYHNNFGSPILTDRGRFVAPVRKLAPRDARAAEGIGNWNQFGPPTPGFAEQVYFMQMHADENQTTSALLMDAAGGAGVAVNYNTTQLPCFTLWKNTAARADGYVCGLEPATNFPNQRSFEEANGRVVNLPAGQSYQIDLSFGLLSTEQEVQQSLDRIQSLQATPPEIGLVPDPDWSDV